MNNKLMITGKQEFLNIEIPIIEGGFGEDKRCLTDKTISEIHNIQIKHIRELITRNIKRFKKGIDLIDLKVVVPNDYNLIQDLGYSNMQISKSKNIFILSERGYAKLIKIMDTDLAWEIHDKLVDDYFMIKDILSKELSNKEQLQLQILNGNDIERVVSLKKFEELVTAPLIETIEKQQPKVDYCDDVLNSEGSMTTTQIAQDYGMSARKLNSILNDLGIQYKNNGQWILYSKYKDKGYINSNTIMLDNGKTIVQTKWTQKGREFIYNVLRENGYSSIN